MGLICHKLQKTKRDIRWLQGVTGEWFEEIQRKKFCNEMDVSQMLKQPLTFRLRKGMAENDCMESHTSRSKNTPNPRNTTSVPSRLNFRSSFASLFSFRKSRKETSKLRLLGRKGCDGHVGPPVSVRQTITQARIYPPPPEYQPVDSAFVCKPAGMREGGVMLPWDASLLENEFFQVLDDLDSTLAQEQSASSVNTRAPLNHGSTRQFSHFYSSENKHGNITGRHKNHYNDTPNMSFYNILRPGNPREGFKIFSPRTRTIYDMYRTRDPRVLKEDHVQMNTFGSASLCFDSRQQSASPATRYFTARSLHFPTITQNKNGFIPASHQQSPKRTPLSSIIWNRPDSSRERPDREEFLRAPSPMEVDSSDQYTYSRCFQENRGYEFYRSQSIYQTVGLNTPMDNAMSPDPFENLENMPFYHQENPFARSFFSKTFGHSRGQRFGQSPFWGQQEEHSSCPDFHQSRKPFTSSDRDFELISSEANGASPGHGQNVPPQHWGSFSPNYRTNISGEQKQPHPWQFASQTSTLESMEVSQGNGNHTTHFGTPNACSMTGSSYHIRSGGLECQQDSSSTEVHIHKEPYSFGRAQTVASSFKTSFPQVPDNRGNPQSPNFQNPTITLQKSKPPSLPIKSYTEITEVNSNSVDSPPLIENQPNILVTEVNNEKDLNESILEKDKQLDEVDQTNVTGETPQAVSQTVITDPVPGFQNPRSQDLAKCIFDAMEEQCTTTHSANCSKSAASHSIPCDSLDLSAGTLPDSSPLNDSCLDALGIPSAAGFSRKSPAGKDPSLGEREEKDSSKSQSTHFSVGPSENQKRDASCMPVHNREADAIECHLHPPLREGKGKGKVRHCISCPEKLSNTEGRSTPASGSSSLTEVNQSNPVAPGLHTVYCTLPRTPAGFLSNRKSESKIMASSFRNEPLPFQVENNVEDPIGKYTSIEFSPSSSESESKCSKAVSDSVSAVPEATGGMTDPKSTGPASGRKGPPPLLIERAVSCPSGAPSASTGKGGKGTCLYSDTDASAVTPRPWGRVVNPLGSDSSVTDCPLTQGHSQKDCSPECTKNDGKSAASRAGIFSLSDEDPLPFSSDMSGKGSRKTLHKFKTTSMFSVSEDEDNVKCLEVVSVYYTLPRKPSKKFCSLLQKFTQNIDSLTEATKSETETFSHVLEKDKVNYSTQEQSGTLSAGDLKMLVSSAQNSRCLSHATENMTILQLPGIRPSESMLQEIASIEADAPLHKGGPNAGEMSPENVAKTQNRRERGVKLQSETLHASSMLQEKEVTEEKSENYQQPVESGNSGPSTLSSHSDKNVENSQTIRGSGEYAGHGRANTATGNGRCLQNDATGIAIDESSSGLQPGGSGGGKGAGFQKKTERAVSDSESQIFALTPALQKLQLDEKTCLGETDLDSFQSESSELPQRSQVVNTTENSKAEGEMQELAQGQPLYPGRGNKNKTILDDLEKGKSRSSGKHRLAAMSKAGRKYPSKDLSPRRHVATVFPQSGNGSAKCLSFGMPECHPLSPEPTSKSTESTDGSRLNNDGVDVAKSEISNREASIHLSKWKPNSTSQPRKNKLKNISEPPPKYENSKDVTVSPILERKSGDLAQGTFTTIREAAFSDHRKRLNSPFPLETADQSIISIPLATCQQQRSASSPEWEPELHPYRSKSLKGINVHGDLLRKSSPPKVRDRHFSESTSIDSTLSQLTLGNEFSNSGYGRKFRSFSELPSCNANKSSAVYSGRKKAGPLSATSISRPIDYGIFGKDQQLAFLENVKRSLTQGRLWKPSFLKNPGFLKDDIINPPNPAGSSNSNSPRNQMPEDGLFPSAPLNIYEEDPVDSDCNTDTTTDDEYYLDENDKESEL
ncbi:exophilin-5 isoform X3 [Manis pentadactyla]|uniref:exophilin-5 isoform X3 n=1 Tax=Manis pentadactyla TaxID=143292 RepID=UPI00255C97F5|nr:exophilin-5 isoform X3 [Manis pentadactyla]